MSKHTPGPWRVSKNDSIYAKDEFIGIALSGKPWGRELPQEANARLMAAAPELYDALRDLYNASVLKGIAFDTAWQNAITLYEELTAKIEGDESNT